MRKELFYVAASRGRESITVVTSDKELLQETVAHSDARQSASELLRRASAHSLETIQPSLRDRERRELSIGDEQAYGAVADKVQVARSKTGHTVDQEQSSCDQKQERQVTEPSQHYGISR
jgi:hypothetical protein